MDFLSSLDDGWTIYLWLVVGVLIVLTCLYMLRWALHNEQFDEDIKYLVFNKDDKSKMTTEEFEKSQQVLHSQEESRARHLAQHS